jgi:hypothetical protein
MTERERIERRRQPRDSQAPADWETIVLQRMAGRIESLSRDATPDEQPLTDGSWENAALHALRRRMKDLDSR